ncbi:MAG: hypothetical protein NTW94_07305 [Legionellales bacterium]|nr:hypothetical protein [Legionellales bacterium]
MDNNWPTKDKDMFLARLIMDEFSGDHYGESLGLFELVMIPKEKRMSFRLSHWVLVMAQQFNALYGASQGDFVTRQVISRCMIQENTLH